MQYITMPSGGNFKSTCGNLSPILTLIFMILPKFNPSVTKHDMAMSQRDLNDKTKNIHNFVATERLNQLEIKLSLQ